jgi:hypothetical protein
MKFRLSVFLFVDLVHSGSEIPILQQHLPSGSIKARIIGNYADLVPASNVALKMHPLRGGVEDETVVAPFFLRITEQVMKLSVL